MWPGSQGHLLELQRGGCYLSPSGGGRPLWQCLLQRPEFCLTVNLMGSWLVFGSSGTSARATRTSSELSSVQRLMDWKFWELSLLLVDAASSKF